MPSDDRGGGEQYFEVDPTSESRPRTIRVVLAGREVEVCTDSGVFSPGRLDLGTRVLLRSVPPPPASGHLLDLGCGWGPIALTMAIRSPAATVWAVDVNERSLRLTEQNAQALGLDRVRAVGPQDVPDVALDAVWSNPPIRIGKDLLHGLLEHWFARLGGDAAAHLVVQRNLGADSLLSWLRQRYGPQQATKVASAKGYRVLRVEGPGADPDGPMPVTPTG